MALGSSTQRAIHRINVRIPRLVESYCEGCGLLIAASPSKKILAVMEKLHKCPVYFRYPGHQRAG